uniref:Tick transposon n=1 Tax=Rhipicephalus zambeziensis TaxID=60191 RepID=A0A224Z9K7_9ACAR
MTVRLPATISRRNDSVLHRLRLDDAFTRRYAHLIGRADRPNCEPCKVGETLAHIFCDYPLYVTQRKMLTLTLAGIGLTLLSDSCILSAMCDQTE